MYSCCLRTGTHSTFTRTPNPRSKAVIFSKTYCPYCTKAKKAFSSIGATPFVIELDGRSDGDAVQDELLKLTGGRSVPRVFVGGTFIGGGDDTHAHAASGKLREMCVKAGLLS